MSKLKLASVVLASTDDGRWIPREEGPRLFISGVDQALTVSWFVNRYSYDLFFLKIKTKSFKTDIKPRRFHIPEPSGSSSSSTIWSLDCGKGLVKHIADIGSYHSVRAGKGYGCYPENPACHKISIGFVEWRRDGVEDPLSLAYEVAKEWTRSRNESTSYRGQHVRVCSHWFKVTHEIHDIRV